MCLSAGKHKAAVFNANICRQLRRERDSASGSRNHSLACSPPPSPAGAIHGAFPSLALGGDSGSNPSTLHKAAVFNANICRQLRRERDSNPRISCEINGFRDRPIQPLSHLSSCVSLVQNPLSSERDPLCRPGGRRVQTEPKGYPVGSVNEAERIRTSDLQIRNLMLYPAELQPRKAISGMLCLLPLGGNSGSNPLLYSNKYLHCQKMTVYRSRGDSNPRYPCGAQLLSREPDSAALAPLQLFFGPGLSNRPRS